jgi:hypothetical protein
MAKNEDYYAQAAELASKMRRGPQGYSAQTPAGGKPRSKRGVSRERPVKEEPRSEPEEEAAAPEAAGSHPVPSPRGAKYGVLVGLFAIMLAAVVAPAIYNACTPEARLTRLREQYVERWEEVGAETGEESGSSAWMVAVDKDADLRELARQIAAHGGNVFELRNVLLRTR